jgi:hypothetical protein
MEEVVEYKKQKRVYLVQTSDRVTRYVFSQLKTAVSFINDLPARGLEDSLDYQHISHKMRRYQIFKFIVGGVEHWLQVLPIEGSFRVSSMRRSIFDTQKHVEVDGDLLGPVVCNQFRCEWNESSDLWQCFEWETFKASCKDRPQALLWVNDQALQASVSIF